MRPDPILIAAPTRTGSTMIAWLLHLHGVWIGEAKVTADPTTNPQVGTENVHLKRYLHSFGAEPPGDFKAQIERLVETDGRWLVKTVGNLTRRKAWLQNFPEAHWLLLKRPLADILASRERRHVPPREAAVREQLAMQESLAAADCRSLWVEMNDLCAGGEAGEAEARKVFDFVGIAFQPEVYRDWVQPERWHG